MDLINNGGNWSRMPELPENERPKSRNGSANKRTEINNAINNQLNNTRNRVGSATYYDIASTLLGQGRTDDLDEIFLAAARVSTKSYQQGLMVLNFSYITCTVKCLKTKLNESKMATKCDTFFS